MPTNKHTSTRRKTKEQPVAPTADDLFDGFGGGTDEHRERFKSFLELACNPQAVKAANEARKRKALERGKRRG